MTRNLAMDLRVGSYLEPDVNTYYYKVCYDIMNFGAETAPRGKKTLELHPVFSVIDNPRQRIISCLGRVINLPFALAEVVQILTGQNDAQALRYYNSQIIKIQGDPDERDINYVRDIGLPNPETTVHSFVEGWENFVTRFNAAYGERLRRFDAGIPDKYSQGGKRVVDQLDHVIRTLMADPDSRQASIVISHPYYDNYASQTKDRACNVYAHAMIRNGRLDWMQVMRSNDAVWGLPYNFIQWMHVQEYIAMALDIPMGIYTLVQDSLHVYEDFYEEVKQVQFFDLYGQFEDVEYFRMTNGIFDLARFERSVRTTGKPRALSRSKIPDYWTEVAYVFNAYCVFKQHADEEVWKWVPYTFELRFPLLRWFCSVRWNKDPKYIQLVDRCLMDMKANTKLGEDDIKAYLGVAAES